MIDYEKNIKKTNYIVGNKKIYIYGKGYDII
jgi:hypothetical protein